MSAKSGSFYTTQNVHDVRGRFLGGESVVSIIENAGMGREAVYNYIADLIPICNRKKKGKPSRIDRADLIKMLSRGRSRADIGAFYGVTRQSITMYLRRNPLTDDEVQKIKDCNNH